MKILFTHNHSRVIRDFPIENRRLLRIDGRKILTPSFWNTSSTESTVITEPIGKERVNCTSKSWSPVATVKSPRFFVRKT